MRRNRQTEAEEIERGNDIIALLEGNSLLSLNCQPVETREEGGLLSPWRTRTMHTSAGSSVDISFRINHTGRNANMPNASI